MRTRKITRKGCKNVQLVQSPDYWCDSCHEIHEGEWLVQKIDPKKPAVFVSRVENFEYNGLSGETKKLVNKVTRFPHSPSVGDILG